MGPDYAMKAAPDLLMAKRGESHPTDRADLFGKQFVACIETEEGRRLAEALVEELTGGDRVEHGGCERTSGSSLRPTTSGSPATTSPTSSAPITACGGGSS